jgi:hypothetical protein
MSMVHICPGFGTSVNTTNRMGMCAILKVFGGKCEYMYQSLQCIFLFVKISVLVKKLQTFTVFI